MAHLLITPQEASPDLAQALTGVTALYLKREDLHPYGSHKGRSIPYMIDEYFKKGIRHFALSSSGNAALAAGLYVKELNEKKKSADSSEKITLEIFVGKNIQNKKLEKIQALRDEHILVSIHDRPLQMVFTKVKDPSIIGLRQSTDDLALKGYESLAAELAKIKNLKAIFVGTSSGTTAQALAKQLPNVEMHIVQTSSCHPIAQEFLDETDQDVGESNYETNEKSIADAIVDQTAFRKETLISLLEKNGGAGWIVTNETIHIAQKLVAEHAGISISPNSALSIAGLMNAIYTGKKWNGAVVCLICGD